MSVGPTGDEKKVLTSPGQCERCKVHMAETALFMTPIYFVSPDTFLSLYVKEFGGSLHIPPSFCNWLADLSAL
jgi:hypothetical protein